MLLELDLEPTLDLLKEGSFGLFRILMALLTFNLPVANFSSYKIFCKNSTMFSSSSISFRKMFWFMEMLSFSRLNLDLNFLTVTLAGVVTVFLLTGIGKTNLNFTVYDYKF
jgi:hypothetical protein